MSIENRPNLHAVGLMTDIYKAFKERIRGEAKENESQSFALAAPLIADFCDKLSDALDDMYALKAQKAPH